MNFTLICLGIACFGAAVLVHAARLANRQSQELTPGTCECGHPRCGHKHGTGACTMDWWHGGVHYRCACVCYIRRKDDGGRPPEPPDYTPSPEELERMYR